LRCDQRSEGVITTELITESEASDTWIADHIATWMEQIGLLLEEVVAKSEVDFRIKDDAGVRLIRSQETNLGDFTADALYYLFDNMGMDVDVAIMNGGGIRADMPAGDISYKTTKTVHTFGNVACLQTITGQQLLDALEWGARNVGVGENGGFLQVSGITYEIHSYIESTVQADDKGVWCGAPTGEYRVKNVMVAGEPLDLEATYNLAGYNYTLRDLGDGFAMFDGAVNVLDYVMEDYLVLANYAASFPVEGELPTIKADNSVLGANYGDINGEGRIEIIAEDPNVEEYFAIYNDANAKAMTSEISTYTSSSGSTKDQFVSAAATLNAENKLRTEATNIALFKIETVGGVTSFITEDGKYLFCDGTNMALVDEANEYTEFVLEETEGGYFIRLANFLYNGEKAQYIEYYKEVFTVFGMGTDTSIYTFTFREIGEIVVPCDHVWNDGEVTLEATCTAQGEITYTCTVCGETKIETIPMIDCVDEDSDGFCDTCDRDLNNVLPEIDFADLKDGDVIAIVVHTSPEMTDKDFVLLSNFGATPASNAAEFDGTFNEAMYWTVKIVDGQVYLYCGDGVGLYAIDNNNGLRADAEAAAITMVDGYLSLSDPSGNVRYIGVYDNNMGDMSVVSSPNFRCYKNTTNNTKDQTTTLYKIG